jgi:hypothetical protein
MHILNNKIISNWNLFSFQIFILGILSLITSFFVPNDNWNFHTFSCLLALFFTLQQFFNILKYDFELFLYDFRIIFTASFTLYFIIGAIVLTLGSKEDIEGLMLRFTVDSSTALKIDAMNFIGFSISLFIYSKTKPIVLTKIINILVKKSKKDKTLKIISLLTLVGLISKFIVIANDFSIFNNSIVISGIVRQLSQFLLAVILLSSIYKGKKENVILILSIFLTLFVSIFGLLGFNKTEIIFPIIAFGVGTAIKKESILILIMSIFLGFGLLQVIGGVVNFARINQVDRMTLRERVDVIKLGIDALNTLIETKDNNSANYSAFARISYINAQSAAVHFYDINDGSNDYLNLHYTLIPRFLYKDKPILTGAGSDLNYKMYGNDASAEGTGIFIDGYYNFGWFGLILGSMICGWILSQISAIARIIILNKNFIFYPVNFFGIFIAFRIDGTIISDYFGQFIIIIYAIFILFFLKLLFYDRKINL